MGDDLLRVVFFIFNTVLWALGWAIFGIGITIIVSDWDWENLITNPDDNPETKAAQIMITCGAIIAIYGVLGFCAAIKINRIMLLVYAFITFCVLVVQVGAGSYVADNRKELLQSMETGVRRAVDERYGSSDVITKAIDFVQENVECCGADGPEDWPKSSWYTPGSPFVVPETCCAEGGENCNIGIIAMRAKSGFFHSTGCIEATKEFLVDHLWDLGGVTLAICIVELFQIICAIYLARKEK